MSTPASTTQGTPKAAAANPLKSAFAGLAIVIILIVSFILYYTVLGSPSNFEGGNVDNHPVQEGFGKWLGTIYKGGIIVPILMSMFLMVITFSIERFITIARATGSGSVEAFVRRVKGLLAGNQVQAAIAECNKQKGSVGNVIINVLHQYEHVMSDTQLTKDQKVSALHKELEDSTALEMPMLEKNLTIIATLASVATLTGLLGTVLGMIKAFSALATAGAPDSAALSNGISEALINTALGIGTSAIAIIMYNYFTTRIDSLTYNIDEAGFSIMQNFSAQAK
jgi:biopolymer transport protein ExbB